MVAGQAAGSGQVRDLQPALRRVAALMAQQHALRGSLRETRQAHVEAGRVGLQSPATNQDRLMLGAFEMSMIPRGLSGDPLAAPVGHGDAAVDRHGELERHERTAQLLPGKEARHRAARLILQLTGRHHDAGCP